MAKRSDVLRFADAWLASIPNANTQRSYRRAVTQLREYTAPQREKRQPLSPTMVWGFGCHLQSEYSPSTVNQRVIALRSFFRWLKEAGHDVDTLMAALPRHVSPKYQIEHDRPTVAQAEQLCQPQNFRGPHHVRDRAIVQLAYETGASTAQIVGLTCGDVEGQRVFVGDRLCAVSPALAMTLRALQDGRPTGEPLLRGARGGPLDPRIATRAVRQAAAVAGLERMTLRGLRNAHLWGRVESGERVADVAAELGMTEFSVFRATGGRITGTDGSGYES